MLASIAYESILKNNEKYILVDVRCPREYKTATIPGAINIPLFLDEQYEKIGLCYKEKGKEAAVRLGMEYVSERLLDLYNSFIEIKGRKKIVLFCARGGMRSLSIGSLLLSVGLSVAKIDNGYKGYRQFLSNELPKLVNKFRFITLYGKTGSGKTYILNELSKRGYAVLDLERCANHRGSLLGSIGLGACNSQKMFESLVFDTLQNAKSPFVFTEGESKRIGKIIMPDYLYEAITNGERVLINTDIKKRVENIRNEYITNNTSIQELCEAITLLKPYLGIKKVKEYIEYVNNYNYDEAIERLMTEYYDKAYDTKNKEFIYEFNNIDEYETAAKLINFAENI